MRGVAVNSGWLVEEGYRLDPRPYTDGAVRIRKAVLRLPHTRLSELTAGFKGGIFTHMFSPKRTYVESPSYGIPFLGASSMLLADLDRLPLLSNRNAESRSYKDLRVIKGMTLISCSGSVGRMAYARADMDGMATAGDLLKVQPDPEQIPPGYLFAFLSSRVGSLLVGGGTYGTIVQHIEAQHIANLPVPRIGGEFEEEIAGLVDAASAARTRANELLGVARTEAQSLLGESSQESGRVWSQVLASDLVERMDAFYFSARCRRARRLFDSFDDRCLELAEIADVAIPGIFKRKYADDPRYGHPYVTGGDVFQIAPMSERYLMRSVAERYGLIVRQGTILIQEAGQLGGLIGRSVLVGEHLDGFAVSNNMVRVRPHDSADAGFLYALLSTAEGVLLISRESAGSSIPHLDANRVRGVRIPWPADGVRRRIGKMVDKAVRLRDQACLDEDRARVLMTQAIEEAS